MPYRFVAFRLGMGHSAFCIEISHLIKGNHAVMIDFLFVATHLC